MVPLMRDTSDEQALAVANDSHLGLQAAVYTSSVKRAFHQGNRGFPHAEKDPSKGDAGSAAARCLFR